MADIPPQNGVGPRMTFIQGVFEVKDARSRDEFQQVKRLGKMVLAQTGFHNPWERYLDLPFACKHCAEIHPKNLSKGRFFTYLEDPGRCIFTFIY